MAQKKIYAVRKGKVIGIFNDWGSCKSSIEGYSGAEYKSFTILEQAELYLSEGKKSNVIEVDKERSNDCIVAYVDGSYSESINKYSYGLVLILPNGKEITYSDSQDDSAALSSGNISGELLGTMTAIKKAIELGFKEILIYYDYEGIEKWYTGEWKAKSYVAIKYLEFIDKHKDKISISFEWVKGHSGNKYNDMADKLAKNALSRSEQPKSGSNYIIIEPIKEEDLLTILEVVNDDFNERLNIFRKNEEYLNQWHISVDNEKIVVAYYLKTQKVMLQGKKEKLFTVLSSYLIELVESDKISEIFNPYYNVNIDKSYVENEFFAYLPNKNINFSEKLNNSIKQSIYNLNLNGEMYDYTYLSFPALRALEGFLKYVLQKHRINCDKAFNAFVPKDKINDTYKLDEKYHSNVGSPKKIQYFNKAYDYYRKHRHTLFHWDLNEGNKDTTRILTEDNWKNMINDTLVLINDYFLVR